MPPRKTRKKKDRRSRAEKIRDRHFSDVRVFDTDEAHFAPLPWLYRKLLFAVPPRQWQIVTWLLMRSYQEGIVELDRGELMDDIGFGSIPKLEVHLKQLEALGFIAMVSVGHRRYVAIRHPIDVARHLDRTAKLGDARDRVEDFLEERFGVSLKEERKSEDVDTAIDVLLDDAEDDNAATTSDTVKREEATS